MTQGSEPDASIARRQHWDEVYGRVPAHEVSWYQPEPALGLEIIDDLAIAPNAAIIDVGGGASLLVDALSGRGFGDLTVLDISSRALDIARSRFSRSDGVSWLAADILAWQPERRYDLWCDRAVFHFLTDPADRDRYCSVLRSATAAGSRVVMATFAPNGPERCSGLPVCRYSPESLVDALGPDFELIDARREEHMTPGGATQAFTWVVGSRSASAV